MLVAPSPIKQKVRALRVNFRCESALYELESALFELEKASALTRW
jgi:hypothetical protein